MFLYYIETIMVPHMCTYFRIDLNRTIAKGEARIIVAFDLNDPNQKTHAFIVFRDFKLIHLCGSGVTVWCAARYDVMWNRLASFNYTRSNFLVSYSRGLFFKDQFLLLLHKWDFYVHAFHTNYRINLIPQQKNSKFVRFHVWVKVFWWIHFQLNAFTGKEWSQRIEYC